MKTVIVTGASGNLGQAVVKRFLREGYRVIGTVSGRNAAGITEKNFEEFVVDLTDEKQATSFTGSVISKYGSIDAAVLTVGGFAMGTIADTTTADVLKQYRLNFETAYGVARPVFIQMLQQGSGRIFLVSSRPGLDPHAKGMVAYSLSKSLLVRLADLMNEEAKGHDVVTTIVAPSTIDTPQNRKSMPGAHFESWVKPEQIAGMIWLYCTEDATVIREPLIKVYGNA